MHYFVYNNEGYLLSPFKSNKSVIFTELNLILKNTDIRDRVPIISDERLSGNPHSGGFDSKIIADRLKECFPNAKVFCVIREQTDMILSTYYQYLKIGGTQTLKMYLIRKYDGRIPGFSFDHFRYVDLISYYHQLFHPKNVLVLPYEMFRDDPRNFFIKLGTFLSSKIIIQDSNLKKFHNKKQNDLIRTRLPFLNLFAHKGSVNSFSPLFIAPCNKIIRSLNKLIILGVNNKNKKSDQNYKNQIEAIIKDRYANSNKRLSTLINIDLSQYGYHK